MSRRRPLYSWALTCFGIVLATVAHADKYGIDEALAESDSSWIHVLLSLAFFAYLYFKEK